MALLKTILSRHCCGGPTLVLSLAFVLLGVLFSVLSALSLGVMFITVGFAALGLCLWMGLSRCPRLNRPIQT